MLYSKTCICRFDSERQENSDDPFSILKLFYFFRGDETPYKHNNTSLGTIKNHSFYHLNIFIFDDFMSQSNYSNIFVQAKYRNIN
jgi:hypothetical protein